MSQRERAAVRAVGELLSARDLTLAVAESLTGGELSAAFACAEGASDWYRGAVVAYSSDVKHSLLDVPDGPVVSEPAVVAMATRVTGVLDADVGVAVSGVAGPASQDGQPPGTVWLAIHVAGRTRSRQECFDGAPPEVVDATVRRATDWLHQILRDALGGGAPSVA
jgi:nicotinamide-nucleotide amidase